jgi:hypothetical protein
VVERGSLLPHRALLLIARGIPSGRSLLVPCQSGPAHLQSRARPTRLGASSSDRSTPEGLRGRAHDRCDFAASAFAPPAPVALGYSKGSPRPRRWLVSSADGLSRSKISLPRSICRLPLPTDRPAASVRLCCCPACPWR